MVNNGMVVVVTVSVSGAVSGSTLGSGETHSHPRSPSLPLGRVDMLKSERCLVRPD